MRLVAFPVGVASDTRSIGFSRNSRRSIFTTLVVFPVPGPPQTTVKRRVTAEELPFELMLNALRLTAGVPKRLWTERTGLSDDVIADAVAALQKDGLWTTEPDRIGTSPRGFAFLSSVQEAFL